jgi:hypothetical protein
MMVDDAKRCLDRSGRRVVVPDNIGCSEQQLENGRLAMGNDNTGGAGDVGILGKLIQNLNPYTHEMDLKMLPDPSGLNPSGFGNIEVEVDNSYDAKWDFKGQTLTVKTAVRIPYRFPVKNDKGQILYFQTESLLIGFAGADGGG